MRMLRFALSVTLPWETSFEDTVLDGHSKKMLSVGTAGVWPRVWFDSTPTAPPVPARWMPPRKVLATFLT